MKILICLDEHTRNIPSAGRAETPEDEQVMLEIRRGH
jgi:hypothetical protein